MTMVQIGEGRSLFSRQEQCSVCIGQSAEFEVVFAGTTQLGELKYLLCGTRDKATGSGGRSLSVECGKRIVTVRLENGSKGCECRISASQWNGFKSDLCNEITDALSCPAGTPLIEDPVV
jgi:hypothetical protein